MNKRFMLHMDPPEKRKNSDDALAILLLYRANVSII